MRPCKALADPNAPNKNEMAAGDLPNVTVMSYSPRHAWGMRRQPFIVQANVQKLESLGLEPLNSYLEVPASSACMGLHEFEVGSGVWA